MKMTPLKFWFTLVMTIILVLTIFLVGDALIFGLIALIVSIWNKIIALDVFKWGVIVIFGIQAIITIPCALSCSYERNDKSGT